MPRGGDESSAPLFATAGADGQVALWDAERRRQVRRTTLRADGGGAAAACAVDLHPDGGEVAVGLRDGSVRVLRLPDLGEVLRRRAGQEAVSEIRYSPNGARRALGAAGRCWALLGAAGRCWALLGAAGRRALGAAGPRR